MAGIDGIGGYGYNPYATAFTAQKAPKNQRNTEVKAIYDPEKAEKQRKTQKKILTIAGLAIAAVATYLVLKKTKFGKKLLEKLKGLFKKGTIKTDNPVKTPKTKAAKKVKVITTHANLAPGQKLKMKNGGGKEAIRSARRNKKAIIEATRQLEQEVSKPLTKAELEATGTLHQAATTEELAFMRKNNKQASNTIADFMEQQGITRTKERGKVKLVQQTPKPVTPTPVAATTVNTAVTNTAERITQIESKIAELDKQIARYNHPAMKRYARPFENTKAKLLEELNKLKANAAA